MSTDYRDYCSENPWQLYIHRDADGQPVAIPAHIYCGVRLVATVFDHKSAERMVALHNEGLQEGSA